MIEKFEGNQIQSATDFALKQSLTEYGGWHLPPGLLYHFFKGEDRKKGKNTGLGIWRPASSSARTFPVTLDKSLPLSGPLSPLPFNEKAELGDL